MYCEQCGKWNEDGRKNCFSCGSPLKIDTKNNAPAEDSEVSVRRKSVAEKPGLEKKTEKTALARNRKRSGKQRSSQANLAEMEKELRQLNQKGKPILALLAACTLLVIVLVVLIDQIPKRYGAKKDAEVFETAMLSGEWEQAYDSLYMPGETAQMLSKEVFIDVMNRSGASGFRDLVVEEVSSSADQKVFSAVYEAADGSQKTEYLTMLPTGNKKFYFMKEWKVDPATVCVEDVSITLPEDAKMLLNGLSLESEPVVNPETYTVEYTIPKMFAGCWTVELQAENRNPYYEDIQVSKESKVFSFEGVEMEPDQVLMDSLIQQFGQDYQAILVASVNREDFSMVEQYFTSQAIQEGRAQNLYANACSQAYDPERGTGIIWYELRDTRGTPVPIVKSGYAVSGDVVMEIHSSMNFGYIKDGMEMSETKDSVGLLCFHQENGKWKIQSFS